MTDELKPAGYDLPEIPDLAEHLRDVMVECERAAKWNALVERQQRIVREWNAAQAAEDAEGEALCREAAIELVVEWHALQGRRVELRWFEGQAYIIDLDETDRMFDTLSWSWT